jgi:hypothetical protein
MADSGASPTSVAQHADSHCVVCDGCQDHGGYDTMTIRSGCGRPLRKHGSHPGHNQSPLGNVDLGCATQRICVVPPKSTVLSGDWLCPVCYLCSPHVVSMLLAYV